jgi:hypothetical protein
MRTLFVPVVFSAILAAQDFSQVKPLPPPGIPVSQQDQRILRAGLDRLGKRIEALKGNPHLPDIEIFHKAVRFALDGNEFFREEQIFRAKELLRVGMERADQLANGDALWIRQIGLVVRAYVSKIDGSVQPYGLVLPPSFAPDRPHQWRVDAWFHGRSDTQNEVDFLWARLHDTGDFTPRDTIMLHLYGRYCSASKFAGEVDLFEALDDVRKNYNVDENRILVRGFSMGGASVARIYGLGVGHKYTPEAKEEIEERIDAIAAKGRNPWPRQVRFETWTLKYNRMRWVTVDAMDREYERARVEAGVENDHTVQVKTLNIAAVTFDFGSGAGVLNPASKPAIVIDNQTVSAPGPLSDGSWIAHLHKTGSRWRSAKRIRPRYGRSMIYRARLTTPSWNLS